MLAKPLICDAVVCDTLISDADTCNTFNMWLLCSWQL